ncbi:MAG: dienelactone hydrolase family protein [Bacteroidales bacterium]|jgi:pimeloyl-ACP methyl ester carboxylesterase|nr:dienelactone hydrolase family protein [Bacteroidales bacterium]
MKIIYIIIISLIFSSSIKSQERVNFIAEDGLLITADHYFIDESKPYILLFHQEEYSRGEYIHTAKKFIKFGYNCLAVDLRSGGKVNYIQNRTALRALQNDYPTDFLHSKKDILAAIEWVKKKNNKPMVLLGSSFSASLCLIVANECPDIKAVISFSPGEFFNYKPSVKEVIKTLKKPIFVASSKSEKPYINDLLEFVPPIYKTIFAPSDVQGEHGSKSLWADKSGSQQYWLALTMFFSKIR